LILAFIGLVVGLAVDRQRNEIAVLRSRGATAIQVVGIAALEGMLLGLVALVIGSPLGEIIARIIGQARSFLNFSMQSDLRVGVTTATLRFGIAAVGLAMVAQVVPTIGAARHTIVTYKQERARSLRAPWWQRAWLDVLLLIPAGYGAYLLRKQGSVALPVAGGATMNDPFQNPLLFLVPALGIFALTLIILRILPAVMAGFAWIVSHLGGVGVLLAARYLSRTPGFYSAPLVLLILTLSLSAFTASLAQTLDNHLYDQMYYQVGSEMSLVEQGESTEKRGGPFGSLGGGADTGAEQGDEAEAQGPRWLFLPVSEHLKVPGVRAAARVGRYTFTTRLSGGTQSGTLIGVDRIDFPRVTFWRRDFAPANLGALMNALAIAPNGVLVPRSYMGQHALNVGDTIRVTVNVYGQSGESDMKVVGGFDLFPTWYPGDPEEGPLFVGNLDYLFQLVGGQAPYDVWVKTDPTVDYNKVVDDVRNLNLAVLDWNAPLLKVYQEQRRPERQGLFGLLSVGFGAAALLTILGFLLYALFSFRRRFIELGMLRAIGLSSGQMTAFLAWELAFLILVGLGAGTGLGAWVSALFIPYLQVGAGPSARIPPFLVQIAWPAIFRIYALFGLLFVVALAVLAVLLLRMKIFQAVKLGETA
jgi:putative ABC transport system permease protein